jgi:hypothetical protein
LNGFLLRSYGYRKISIAGAIINTSGVILTSFADSFVYFLLAYGIISCKYKVNEQERVNICLLLIQYYISFLRILRAVRPYLKDIATMHEFALILYTMRKWFIRLKQECSYYNALPFK